MNDTPEPPTRLVNMNHLGRALLEYDRSAGRDAVRLQLQPAGDDARSEPGAARAAARGPLHRRLRAGRSPTRRATPTSCCRRRRSSRTTTSRRATARSACSSCGRSIEPVGEARPNAEVFSELAARLGVGDGRGGDRHAAAHRRPAAAAIGGGAAGARRRRRRRIDGAPVQFVDVFPLTPDRQGPPVPGRRSIDRRRRALRLPARSRQPSQYPLALISPASEKTMSSTLGELRERAAVLQMHPPDAAARGLAHGRSGPRLQRARRSPVPASRSTRTSGPARCRSRRASGARAPTTARRPTRSCPTR